MFSFSQYCYSLVPSCLFISLFFSDLLSFGLNYNFFSYLIFVYAWFHSTHQPSSLRQYWRWWALNHLCQAQGGHDLHCGHTVLWVVYWEAITHQLQLLLSSGWTTVIGAAQLLLWPEIQSGVGTSAYLFVTHHLSGRLIVGGWGVESLASTSLCQLEGQTCSIATVGPRVGLFCPCCQPPGCPPELCFIVESCALIVILFQICLDILNMSSITTFFPTRFLPYHVILSRYKLCCEKWSSTLICDSNVFICNILLNASLIKFVLKCY